MYVESDPQAESHRNEGSRCSSTRKLACGGIDVSDLLPEQGMRFIFRQSWRTGQSHASLGELRGRIHAYEVPLLWTNFLYSLDQAQAEKILKLAGCHIDFHATTHSGHAKEIGASIDPAQCDAVVLVSGDGLPWEYLNGVKSRSDAVDVLSRLPIAQIGAGTSNALTCNLVGPQYADDVNEACLGVDFFSFLADIVMWQPKLMKDLLVVRVPSHHQRSTYTHPSLQGAAGRWRLLLLSQSGYGPHRRLRCGLRCLPMGRPQPNLCRLRRVSFISLFERRL